MDTMQEMIFDIVAKANRLLGYYNSKITNDIEIKVIDDDLGGKVMPKYLDGSFRQKRNGLEYRFMHNDKRISVYGKSKQECWDKRTDKIREIKEPEKTTNYIDWLNQWYNTYKVPYNGADSLKSIRYLIDRYIAPPLGNKPLNRLSGLHIQDLVNQYADKPNTQKKIGDIINASLEKAVKLGTIKSNPFRTVELSPYKAKKRRALEIEEQAKIYNAIKLDKYKHLFMFCCCTGIRITKALEIERKDFNNMEITVVKKQLKGLNETYKVPYLKELVPLPKSGKVFDITYNGARLYFEKLYKKLNIKGCNLHTFRHTFVSNLYHLGVKDKQIQLWAGHSTLAMTMDIYTHLLKQGTAPPLEYLKGLIAQNVPHTIPHE